MITLYGNSSPNVTKISLFLEEAALKYEFIALDLVKAQQFSAIFRAMNPNSKVPVIVDRDGPAGTSATVFESGAILIYLAEKTGLFLPQSRSTERYSVLQWLIWQVAGLGPSCGQHNHFHLIAPVGNDYSRARYFTEAMRQFQVVEDRLAVSPYLGGREYSVADMAVYPWAVLHDAIGLSWDRYRHIPNWQDKIAARPATARAYSSAQRLAEHDIARLQEASEEEKDRLFGRVVDSEFRR
jgi:GST-like protein